MNTPMPASCGSGHGAATTAWAWRPTMSSAQRLMSSRAPRLTIPSASSVPAYRAIADAVHDHECLVFTQITHLGRRAQADGEETNVLLAPSQIPERVHRDVPHELEAEQIAELVRAFGEAARRCRDGGLDGIEISMAHNHLIDQFCVEERRQ